MVKAVSFKLLGRDEFDYRVMFKALEKVHFETVSMDFKLFFGGSLESNYGFEIMLARILGFVRKEKNQYIMTTKGSYYYHYYENFYTLSYIDRMWHLMKKEALPKELIIK